MTKVKDLVTDALIDQIESAARVSFRRHRGSIRGQQLTAADNYDWHLLRAAYQAGHAVGVAAERERCAKACERVASEWDGEEAPDAGYVAEQCAAAIREGQGKG
mgnify:CR=1 FL=1